MSDSHSGRTLWSNGNWSVIECADCGFAHLDPIPSDDDLASIYSTREYYDESPGWLDKDERESAYWSLEHIDKIDAWRAMGLSPGRLLDVGCSGGLLLADAQRAGWVVEGIEPSPTAAGFARRKGLTVHETMFQSARIEPHSFDVIHSRMLLEHLPEPRGFLEWARTVLRPEGILTCHVPNEFNALQAAARDSLGKEQWWIAPPFHINYFTFDGLEHLLRTTGFEPVERDATFPVEWFLLMGDDYVGNDEVGATIHRKRMLLEDRLEQAGERRPLHAYLASRGLGREAIVHARAADG